MDFAAVAMIVAPCVTVKSLISADLLSPPIAPNVGTTEGVLMRAREGRESFIINIDQDWQCRWWSKELGVSPVDLKKAIRQAGPLVRNVRQHLQAMQVSVDRERSPPSAGGHHDRSTDHHC